MTGLLGRACGHARPGTAAPNDHAVWGYSSDAERASVASQWLAAGLAAGQRALYVADAPVDALVADLSSIPDAGAAFERGALVAVPSAAIYDLTAPIDPEAQLASFAAAVDEARAAGHTGLRVAADITVLVAEPSRRRAHLHWEQYADRYIAVNPLAPMCLYDTRRIEGIEAIACVHPLRGPREPGFAVFAGGPRRAALWGEVDSMDAGTFAEILECLPAADDMLDLTPLEFLDGRGAWTLHRELVRRADAGRPLSVTGAAAPIRRVWHVCGFDPHLLASA